MTPMGPLRARQRLEMPSTFTAAQAHRAGLPSRDLATLVSDLIDDIPAAVHIAVPRGTRRPAISFPPIVVAQYAAKAFDVDIERYEAAPGEFVPVYDAARSVVDAMRHRYRIGHTLALGALGRLPANQQARRGRESPTHRARTARPLHHPTGRRNGARLMVNPAPATSRPARLQRPGTRSKLI